MMGRSWVLGLEAWGTTNDEVRMTNGRKGRGFRILLGLRYDNPPQRNRAILARLKTQDDPQAPRPPLKDRRVGYTEAVRRIGDDL